MTYQLTPEQVDTLIAHGVSVTTVVLGAVLGYGAARWQVATERRRRRRAVASGLLIELAILERILRVFYGDANAIQSYGKLPTPLLDRQFDNAIELFQPETVRH